MASLPRRQRVAAYAVILRTPASSSGPVTTGGAAADPEILLCRLAPRISRQELGRIVGCSREMAGRVLKNLEEQGMVKAKGMTIVVLGTR